MTLQERVTFTIEEFERLVNLPENADKLFEFIGGEIVEVPSNPYSSAVGYNLGFEVKGFVKQHKLGHVTGEAGGYIVAGERYAPDVAYISYSRQPELAREGYNPNPPDLAIEVEFPTSIQSERQLRIKLANYLAVGTVVWVIYPETKEVEVYLPGRPVKILGINETLDGGEVLPGFQMAVRDIFAE
jgi:Uma2 family endonuclease